MANHCWNNVTIEGKPDVLAKLEVLFNDYKKYDYMVNWGNTFFPNMENKPADTSDYLFYGTRWWEFDCVMISDTTLQISGDSAWGPPEGLIQLISEHYQVECEITFSESGCDFAGKRTWQNGDCIDRIDQLYSQHVYDERGMDGLIEEYLYDENCLEYYDSPQAFLDAMGVDVEYDEMDTLKKHFKELKVIDKQEVIDGLEEIITHLKHLSMEGLAKKVEKMHEVLSNEWEEELKVKENEQ
jgi:hypothetical protein